MAGIQSIFRDQAYPPFIIRMVTDDSLTTVGTAGYLTAQAANIAALNGGDFEWDINDFFLVSTPGGWGMFYITPDFTSMVAFALSTDIVNPPVDIGNIPIFDSTQGNLVDSGFDAGNIIYSSTTTLTSDQIKNLYETPVVISQAILGGYFLLNVVYVNFVPNSVPYTG